MNTSIDTLKLRLTDYSVSLNNKLCTINNIDFNGQSLSERKYINSDQFNFDLSDKGAFIKISAPKIIHGSNEKSIDENQLKKALEITENALYDNGIKTNLFTSDLSRTDFFKGERLRYTFDEYAPVFNLLQGKRQNKRDYGSTFLFENTLRQFCIYDKEVEQKTRLGESNIMPSNNVRGEVRLLNKKAIKNTGLITANDLIKNYDFINEIYVKNVGNIFRIPIDEVEQSIQLSIPIICQNEVERKLIEFSINRNGNLGMTEIKKFMMLNCINDISELMPIETFIDTCVRCCNYSNARVLRGRLRELFSELTFGEKLITSKVKTLYNELYLKFAV